VFLEPWSLHCPVEGWLLVTDRWTNGWRAGVNGKPAQLFGGDFIFRALAVKAGKNTVELSYRPAGWPGLLLLSWSLLVTVLLLTLWQLINPGSVWLWNKSAG
jgi:uncharacterized membrane protein YfhO